MSVKSRRKKRNVNKASMILIFGGLAIFIPVVVLAWIIISALLDTGTPILGDRYKDDLSPAIIRSDINKLESSLKNLSSVDKANVELATATLRVYVDTDDSFSEAQISDKVKEAYNSVLSVLDSGVYFSQKDGKKMYDLEVHGYNNLKNKDKDDFIYVILTKTSKMEEPRSQIVSKPIDAELAQQLRDDVEARKKPKEKAKSDEDLTVGSQETEEPKKEEKTE